MDEGSSDVTDGGEKETDTESRHGSQWPSDPSHEGVKTIVEDGGSYDDSKSVEVCRSAVVQDPNMVELTRNQIVGSAIEGHGGRHRIERVSDTPVTQVEDGDDEKDGTSVKRLLELIDKLVIPKDFGNIEVTMILSRDPTGLGSVPEVVSTLPHSLDTTIGQEGLENLDGLEDD